MSRMTKKQRRDCHNRQHGLLFIKPTVRPGFIIMMAVREGCNNKSWLVSYRNANTNPQQILLALPIAHL
jgi:hypothetical protein